jgi:hypothetical protein
VPTAEANAYADAEYPDGNDVDCGIRNRRVSGTAAVMPSGRCRRSSIFVTALTLTEATSMLPRRAASPALAGPEHRERAGDRQPQDRVVGRSGEHRTALWSWSSVAVAVWAIAR